MFFYKQFDDFSQGVSEMKKACKAICDCIENAHARVQIPSDLTVPLGLALQINYEMVLKFLLIHQVSENPLYIDNVYARGNRHGFVYRTRSKFIFGWRRLKKGNYSFVVTLLSVNKISLVEPTAENFRNLGWKEANTNRERANEGRFLSIQ